ncbi:MAG: hypothetical protein M1812_003614 [Candelaria pacifica]|nr:MAG: hypothetical protein M1812_003614 [Candelaria pacifica]
MRYQDWDVLLFPEVSRVPIQEFKTGCFVVQDPESAYLQTSATAHLQYPVDYVVPIQIPVVTSFVPNLPSGTPFQVSVHSWAPPRPSRITEGLSRENDEVLFEARIFIDGRCVAGRYFGSTDAFPQVVYEVAEFDKNGEHDDLRFPSFHSAMLSQSWWNAGEALGRIKIVLSEGLVRKNRHPPFERIKNIVSFSFQHVPLEILETSGIAWPNSSMWQQGLLPLSGVLARKEPSIDPDAHAHSPRRTHGAGTVAKMVSTSPVHYPIQPYNHMQPPALPFGNPRAKNPSWVPTPANNDPYLDGANRSNHLGWAGRLSSDDQSMPDYSNSIPSASSRDVTDGSVVRSKASSLNEGFIDHKSHSVTGGYCDPKDTVDLSSPRKDGTSGTFTLTDNVNRATAPSPAPSLLRPSAAAKARHESYSQMIARKVSEAASADVQLWHDREASDISMKSRFSEDLLERTAAGSSKVHKKPATNIRGKKEGRDSKDSSEVEILQYVQKVEVPQSAMDTCRKNSKTTGGSPEASSGPKRKRSELLASKTISTSENDPPSSSPSRKASRSASRSGQTEYDSAEVCPSSDREPLGDLLNVQ